MKGYSLIVRGFHRMYLAYTQCIIRYMTITLLRNLGDDSMKP